MSLEDHNVTSKNIIKAIWSRWSLEEFPLVFGEKDLPLNCPKSCICNQQSCSVATHKFFRKRSQTVKSALFLEGSKKNQIYNSMSFPPQMRRQWFSALSLVMHACTFNAILASWWRPRMSPKKEMRSSVTVLNQFSEQSICMDLFIVQDRVKFNDTFCYCFTNFSRFTSFSLKIVRFPRVAISNEWGKSFWGHHLSINALLNLTEYKLPTIKVTHLTKSLQGRFKHFQAIEFQRGFGDGQ